MGKREVQNLPLNGRNFAQLVYLVPGVTTGQAGENLSGSSSFNPRAASDFNALGSQANTNAWIVDGIVDNEYTFNTVMVQPSVESIAEFKVLTGSYSANYGVGAGVVSVSTRSGANALHGEVFLYLRNSAVDARNYFARVGSAVQKPAYRRGQFGGAVAAAIIKDKLFYFADYYGQRSLKGIVNQNNVPTAAERVGDFSGYTNTSGALIPIYDPLSTVASVNGSGQTVYTRTQFMGCNGGQPNVICPSRLDPVGLNLASIYPSADRPRKLQQLRLNRRPDHRRQRWQRTCGLPLERQGLHVRAFQLREVRAKRSQPADRRSGYLLPSDAADRGKAIRPRTLRGRYPAHDTDRTGTRSE